MSRLLSAAVAPFAVAVVLLNLLVGCSTPGRPSQAGPEWVSNMHRLSSAHLRLMPLAADAKKFADPANREEIKSGLKEMAEAASKIVHDKNAPDADPLIAFSAGRFAIEVRQANQAFNMNDTQWARYSLSRAGGYCISCHTRSDRGAKDFDLAWTPKLDTLTPAQRVEYLLANRRYSLAYKEAATLTKDETFVKVDPRAWMNAIERVMAMTVRVRNDRPAAEALARAVASNKSAPYYMRRDASAWLNDIRDWRNEKPATTKNPFATAARFVKASEKYGPKSSAALILNLRASASLHTVLENVKSERYGEGLLYSGIVAQSLGNLNLGFLDQFYFERCIRHEPHTELSERCFSNLERAVNEANPYLDLEPESEWAIKSQLEDLRKLAEVKDPLEDPRWNLRYWQDEFFERGGRTR